MNWRRIAVTGLIAGMVAVTGCSSNIPETNQGNRNGQRVVDSVNRRPDSYSRGSYSTNGTAARTTRGMRRVNTNGTPTTHNMNRLTTRNPLNVGRPQGRIGNAFRYGTHHGYMNNLHNNSMSTADRNIVNTRTTRNTAVATPNRNINNTNQAVASPAPTAAAKVKKAPVKKVETVRKAQPARTETKPAAPANVAPTNVAPINHIDVAPAPIATPPARTTHRRISDTAFAAKREANEKRAARTRNMAPRTRNMQVQNIAPHNSNEAYLVPANNAVANNIRNNATNNMASRYAVPNTNTSRMGEVTRSNPIRNTATRFASPSTSRQSETTRNTRNTRNTTARNSATYAVPNTNTSRMGETTLQNRYGMNLNRAARRSARRNQVERRNVNYNNRAFNNRVTRGTQSTQTVPVVNNEIDAMPMAAGNDYAFFRKKVDEQTTPETPAPQEAPQETPAVQPTSQIEESYDDSNYDDNNPVNEDADNTPQPEPTPTPSPRPVRSLRTANRRLMK